MASTRYCNKYNGMSDRIENYRIDKNFKSKSEFAKWIGVTVQTYSMILTSYRPISDTFLDNLVLKTGLPEEYWFFGITDKEYVAKRESFKSMKRVLKDLLKLGVMNKECEFSSNENEEIAKVLIFNAATADFTHLLKLYESEGMNIDDIINDLN